MANAKLRLGACGGLRELSSAELTLVGGARYCQPRSAGGMLDIRSFGGYQDTPVGWRTTRNQWRRLWG